MNAIDNTLASDGGPAQAPTRAVRPFYWSLRRELWEHRAFYLAPAVVAILFLLAAFASAFKLPDALARFDSLPAEAQRSIASAPYVAVAVLLMLTSAIVALFYCLDALYGERRDRSVLFWKSLPVSDLTSVLAKLAMPMIVAPLIVFVLIIAAQLVVLIGHLIAWSVLGLGVGNLLQQLPLLDMPLGVAHFLLSFSIWYAPVYAWLLLVSAWAQRSPVVWAIVPWIVLVAFERMMLSTRALSGWLRERLLGSFEAAFSVRESAGGAAVQLHGASEMQSKMQSTEYVPDVLRFLGNSQVWIGLAIAVVLIGATIWLRRRQESQSA